MCIGQSASPVSASQPPSSWLTPEAVAQPLISRVNHRRRNHILHSIIASRILWKGPQVGRVGPAARIICMTEVRHSDSALLQLIYGLVPKVSHAMKSEYNYLDID